jgi:DNA-directed RNA polymerase specialized sigma24 family protein
MVGTEATYLSHLHRIAGIIARRNHLDEDETAAFIQHARVRLHADDYAVLRKFDGRSSFYTYLTTIMVRLFRDWRIEQ